MPRLCTICADSEKLAKINNALIIEKRTLYDTATRFNVSRPSLGRHRLKCLALGDKRERAPGRHSGIKKLKTQPVNSHLTPADLDPIAAMIQTWEGLARESERQGNVRELAQSHEMILKLRDIQEKKAPPQKDEDFSDLSTPALFALDAFHKALKGGATIEEGIEAIRALGAS